MIKHIVFLAFREDVNNGDVVACMEGFRGLADSIGGIVSYTWGANNSPEALTRGYTHAFVMEIESNQYRRAYLDHPDHKAFASETVVPLLQDGLNSVCVLDFDI